jgi:hypothetical protein
LSADLFRWATVFLCLFDVGCLASLYVRVGHLILPKAWMRFLMAGNVLWLLVAACGAASRVGEEMNWRTPAYTVAAILELVGFLGLYHWYGTPRGLAHTAAILGSDREWEYERRVRQTADHPARRAADTARAR